MIRAFQLQAQKRQEKAYNRMQPTPRQLSLIAMRFKQLGFERDERLYHLTVLTGRYVRSSKDLTFGEGCALLDLLGNSLFVSYLKGEIDERFQPTDKRTA